MTKQLTSLLHPARSLVLLALLVLAGTAGCTERVDADYAVSGDGPAETWRLVGTFGGTAEVTEPSDDPYEIRFTPGAFKVIAGVCATDSEVWVCDLDISRIQIFDFDGNLLRTIGSGVSIADTLPDDREMYLEDVNFPTVHEPGLKRWEQAGGLRWATDLTGLFRAADVLVCDEGYLLADRAYSAVHRHAIRDPRVRLYRPDGTTYDIGRKHAQWPAYLAREDMCFAMSETPGNALWLGKVTDLVWDFTVLTETARFRDIMKVKLDHVGDENYQAQLRVVTAAGNDKNEYNGIGGVAMKFGKLVACDPGNKRLQVMEARREKASNWGKVVRVVTNLTDSNDFRFDSPLDLDISDTGRIYLLDGGRLEVAILSENFERIGSFGKGEIIAPWAIDLSDDGNHLFVSDQRTNQVLHYERDN